jgi:hypothetical protein
VPSRITDTLGEAVVASVRVPALTVAVAVTFAAAAVVAATSASAATTAVAQHRLRSELVIRKLLLFSSDCDRSKSGLPGSGEVGRSDFQVSGLTVVAVRASVIPRTGVLSRFSGIRDRLKRRARRADN